MARRLDHAIPYWILPDAEFFVTVCVRDRGSNILCRTGVGEAVLESISWRNRQQRWFCSLALLMPDHIHMIIQFRDGAKIEAVMHEWKGWLAKKHGIVWQPDFFDHRIRHEESLDEKGKYILQNPVRAGFVERVEDWPWVWISGG